MLQLQVSPVVQPGFQQQVAWHSRLLVRSTSSIPDGDWGPPISADLQRRLCGGAVGSGVVDAQLLNRVQVQWPG
jgi:hypothetical protein